MADSFFKVAGDVIKESGLAIPAIGLLGYLSGKLIETIIQRQRDDTQEFRTAYAKFHDVFTPYLQQLETTEASLNAIIVSEFPRHDLARRDFIRHLSKSRKRQFNHKWLQYEEKYYEIKSLGPLGICCAIAPSEFDLEKAKCSPHTMLKWDIDRRKELHNIILDLLKISERKGWL